MVCSLFFYSWVSMNFVDISPISKQGSPVCCEALLLTAISTKVVPQICKSVHDNADWHYV